MTVETKPEGQREGDWSLETLKYRYPGEWLAVKVEEWWDRLEKEPHRVSLLSHSPDEQLVASRLIPGSKDQMFLRAPEGNVLARERNEQLAYFLERSFVRLLNGRYIEAVTKADYEEIKEDIERRIQERIPWVDEVLETPGDHYYTIQGDGIYTEEFRHEEEQRALLGGAAMIATVEGDQRGLRALGALLVTQHVDTKSYIANFLGNLTDNELGRKVGGLPPKDLVLEWVQKIKDNDVQLKPRISEFLTEN